MEATAKQSPRIIFETRVVNEYGDVTSVRAVYDGEEVYFESPGGSDRMGVQRWEQAKADVLARMLPDLVARIADLESGHPVGTTKLHRYGQSKITNCKCATCAETPF